VASTISRGWTLSTCRHEPGSPTNAHATPTNISDQIPALRAEHPTWALGSSGLGHSDYTLNSIGQPRVPSTLSRLGNQQTLDHHGCGSGSLTRESSPASRRKMVGTKGYIARLKRTLPHFQQTVCYYSASGLSTSRIVQWRAATSGTRRDYGE
jgi:hypothetical protein